LDRREAVLLLGEIRDCPEAVLIKLVFLKPSATRTDYELHIKTELGNSIPKCMACIVKNHGLRINQDSDGFLVICEHEKRLLEIAA
jgi:hypothetical protein